MHHQVYLLVALVIKFVERKDGSLKNPSVPCHYCNLSNVIVRYCCCTLMGTLGFFVLRRPKGSPHIFLPPALLLPVILTTQPCLGYLVPFALSSVLCRSVRRVPIRSLFFQNNLSHNYLSISVFFLLENSRAKFPRD